MEATGKFYRKTVDNDADICQFLKFQVVVEKLTAETNELKSKIETHKRENRRLSNAIDQHRDDASRLATRLAGTEKQRDDALEALVLQQEIAEELERERKRNKKELAGLQHQNSTVLRQRDEAQRVVLHLRSLISGQTHHMEHIVRTINSNEVPEFQEFEQESEIEDLDPIAENDEHETDADSDKTLHRQQSATSASEDSGMETRFFDSPRTSKRFSQISIIDVADRHLRDKTDAIAHIIRNISEQCAAAVEGLQLAHDADAEDEHQSTQSTQSRRKRVSGTSTIGGGYESGLDSETGDSLLHPRRASSIPPTPDLIHRSSTSMSTSSSVTANERSSMQYASGSSEMPTRIVEDDDELSGRSDLDNDGTISGVTGKFNGRSARISALGAQPIA